MARQDAFTAGRVPPLIWRRPGFLWGPVALAIALGAPALVFFQDGGFAQMVVVAAAVGLIAALVSLAIASAAGRPPRSRREIVLHALWLSLLSALLAPVAFQALLTAMEGIEAPSGPVGLDLMLPLALWPLAILIGLPTALFGGLTLGYIAFTPAWTEEDAPHRHPAAAEPR